MTHTNLINMEYEVKLTHILKTLVKGLHKNLDQVEDAKFTLGRIHTEDKVQCGIVAVDELVVSSPNKAAKVRKPVIT